MEKRPRNKLVLILLTLSVLAFLSVSIIPLVSSLFAPPDREAGQPNTPNAPASSDQEKLLEERETGYLKVIEREPNNQTALSELYKTRAQLIQLGKRTPKDLIQPLGKLAELNPDQTDYAVLLAQTYEQVEDREAAATTYRQILEEDQGNTKALQGLVSLLLQEEQAASAIELLRTTLAANQEREDFDRAGVELLLGDVYTAEKSYDQALALYDRLLAKSPDDYRPMVGKAIALKSQGKTSDAQVWIDKATALAPAQFREQIQQLAQETPSPISPPSESP